MSDDLSRQDSDYYWPDGSLKWTHPRNVEHLILLVSQDELTDLPEYREQRADFDAECSSCTEDFAEKCPKSERPCGHHCNHSWDQDQCCWCGKEFGETCDHGQGVTDYCLPCGRINGGGQ